MQIAKQYKLKDISRGYKEPLYPLILGLCWPVMSCPKESCDQKRHCLVHGSYSIVCTDRTDVLPAVNFHARI